MVSKSVTCKAILKKEASTFKQNICLQTEYFKNHRKFD